MLDTVAQKCAIKGQIGRGSDLPQNQQGPDPRQCSWNNYIPCTMLIPSTIWAVFFHLTIMTGQKFCPTSEKRIING